MKPSRFFTMLGAAALPLLAASARAQINGDQDSSFATGPDSNGSVRAIALQPDGQVLVAGGFTAFRGVTRTGLARLHGDGTLDAFNPGLAIGGYPAGAPTVAAVAVQGDGKVLAAGNFSVLNQAPGGGVVRLNADGSLDSSFNAGKGVYDAGDHVGTAEALAVLPNGQVLVGGDFRSFNGVPVQGLVRLNADGSVDPTFNPGGAGITANGYGRDVKSIAILANGQILIAGHFKAYDGVTEGCIARLNADGALDPTFNDGQGPDYGVNALAVQADGKVLVGGGYNNFDGISVQHLVRLNADGSLDTGYNFLASGMFIEEVDAILVQSDGKAIIAGNFLRSGDFVNTPASGLIRIFPDASTDTFFQGGNDVAQGVALALQPDGNLLVAYDEAGFAATGPGDVVRVFDAGPSIPTVTIRALAAKVDEDGQLGPASFEIDHPAAVSSKVKVYYSVKGTAVNGVDYQALNGKAKLKPGAASGSILVQPIDRGITGGRTVSVKVTLLPGAGYILGAETTAKVKIVDND